jgi:hypothetical protein
MATAQMEGKEARQRISRSAQAAWEPDPDRVGPVEVLAEQDLTRVPELVPVRYGRMLASAFTFYRGGSPRFKRQLHRFRVAAVPPSG